MKLLTHSLKLKFIALVTCLSAAGATAKAQVIYSEDFTRSNTGGNFAVNTLGWNAYFSGTASDISSSNTQVAITPAAGNPNTTYGALYAAPSANNQIFAAVESLSTSLVIPTNGAGVITWTMGNGNTSSTVRILIQIGGNGTTNSGTWYASSTAFSSSTSYASFSAFSSANTASVTQTLSFSSAAASWMSFTLDPGTQMSLGSVLTSDLSSNAVTGIGFFMANSTSGQNFRLDTLTVVPEPSSAGLLAATGAALIFGIFRRRSKA